MGSAGEKDAWHPTTGVHCQSVQGKALQATWLLDPTHCTTLATSPPVDHTAPVTREESRHDFCFKDDEFSTKHKFSKVTKNKWENRNSD